MEILLWNYQTAHLSDSLWSTRRKWKLVSETLISTARTEIIIYKTTAGAKQLKCSENHADVLA